MLSFFVSLFETKNKNSTHTRSRVYGTTVTNASARGRWRTAELDGLRVDDEIGQLLSDRHLLLLRRLRRKTVERGRFIERVPHHPHAAVRFALLSQGGILGGDRVAPRLRVLLVVVQTEIKLTASRIDFAKWTSIRQPCIFVNFIIKLKWKA